MSVNIQTTSGLVKIAGTPTIDTALSNVSKNPVQNKVITEKIDEINSNLSAYLGVELAKENIVIPSNSYATIGNLSYIKGSTFDCFIETDPSTPETEFIFTNEDDITISDAFNVIDFANGKFVTFNVTQNASVIKIFANGPATFSKLTIFNRNGIQGELTQVKNDLEQLPYNLIDLNKVVSGKKFDNSDVAWSTSDYIYLKGQRTLSVCGKKFLVENSIQFYDESKKVISTVIKEWENITNMQIPSNAVYCRITIRTYSDNNDLATVMLCYGNVDANASYKSFNGNPLFKVSNDVDEVKNDLSNYELFKVFLLGASRGLPSVSSVSLNIDISEYKVVSAICYLKNGTIEQLSLKTDGNTIISASCHYGNITGYDIYGMKKK